MRSIRPLIGLLALLVLVEAALQFVAPTSIESGTTRGLLLGFLFGIPAGLAALLSRTRQRWAVMTTVMYGTIALALDLATIVQELSQATLRIPVVTLTVVSSLCCFLLLILGGRAVLTTDDDVRPGGDRHPNLRSPSSF